MGSAITVPYSGHIAGGVQIGTDVVISGRTHFDFRKFSINLCSGPTLDSECIFHFNPRFDDGKVVRNHKQCGSWGQEESSGGMPFRRGHTFDVHLLVEASGYKVTVNNHHFCHFHHRLPKEMVQYIYIDGDIQINFIQFKGHGHHHGHHHEHHHSHAPVPSFVPAPAYPPVPSYPSAFGGPIFNPPVPLTTAIPGGLSNGKIIYISGVPNYNASRFSINLTCGAYDSADYGLHFDVRFNYGNDQNTTVRTHRLGGSYGSEEKHQSYFPFSPGANFEIMILTEHYGFKIAVNNQHYTEFNHRIHPVYKIDHLNIVGDVRLTQVRFQ